MTKDEMNDIQRLSYALGMSMGHNFMGSGIKNLDAAFFTRGVQSAYGQETPLLTLEEAKATMDAFFTAMQERVVEENKKKGQAFLEQYAKDEGVVVLPSGLMYKVIRQGEGRKPSAADKVRVHYTGRTVDGHVFDSSESRGEPAEFGVTQVIAGWVEALQLMQEGSRWQLAIPSELAYGARGAGQAIAPYSTLIFDVELIKVL